MKERHKSITSAYLLLEKDGKFLFLRRYETGYMDGKLSLPAGHADPDEALIETMAREAKERKLTFILSLKI